jgi:hypothetical protein
LAEDLDFEDVRDDLLRLAINIRVHQRDVIVASDHVPKRRESLLNALKSNGVREGISQVLQFLVRRCGRYEEPVAVAGGETADDAGAADGGVYYGDHVAELGFEGGVEVGAALDGGEAVGICEFGEDADVAAVFELDAWIRGCVYDGTESEMRNVRVAMVEMRGWGWR